MTTELKSMFSWIKTWVAPQAAMETSEAQTSALSDFDSHGFDPRGFDPIWHGDHWQNLLSSPMDARRYVIEDWTVASPPAFDNSEAADAPEQPEGEMEAVY